MIAEALRNREPWLEWAGKREKKACEVDPVALHIHERISAQAMLRVAARQDVQRSLFADPEQEYREAVQFYQHDITWANRTILGDHSAPPMLFYRAPQAGHRPPRRTRNLPSPC